MKNPYLEKVQENEYESDDILSTEGYRRRSESKHSRMDLVREYAWAIPNEDAIETVVEYSPIIEIGAGTGYWASLVDTMGGDIIATDDMSRADEYVNSFYDVKEADASISSEYPNRTLFLCWPEYDDPMGHTALRNYSGDSVILVGEASDGCTGDRELYRELRDYWTQTDQVEIPSWYGIRDSLRVYERSA